MFVLAYLHIIDIIIIITKLDHYTIKIKLINYVLDIQNCLDL